MKESTDVYKEAIEVDYKLKVMSKLGAEEFFKFHYKGSKDELLPVSTEATLDRFKRAAEWLAKRQKTEDGWATWKPAAQSHDEYVKNANDPNYFRSLSAEYKGPFPAKNPNLFSFVNSGGLLNGGVCWWHSRFQRAALYLTYYATDKPPLSDVSDIRDIIEHLMLTDEIVEIPFFESFSKFSEAYRNEIQTCLELTQIIEGIFLFAWINGLSGHSKVSTDEMKKLMDAIYEEVSEQGMAYVKLAIPGIDAHAWLITEMQSNGDHGYRYRFIDSNFPYNSLEWEYKIEDQCIEIPMIGNLGVPYLQRGAELESMKQIISDFIGSLPIDG